MNALVAARNLVKGQRSLLTAIINNTPEVYSHVCPVANSTIGGHIRHSTDHFNAWLVAAEGIAGSPQNGPMLIDYDHRDRNTPVEVDPIRGIEALDNLVESLQAFGNQEELMSSLTHAPISCQFMVDGQGTEQVFESTIGRELWFVTHHAIHHNATIKHIIHANWGFPGEQDQTNFLKDIPQDFHLAPSTSHYKSVQHEETD